MPSYPKLGPWYQGPGGWARQWGGIEALKCYDENLEMAAVVLFDGHRVGVNSFTLKAFAPDRTVIFEREEERVGYPYVQLMGDCDVFLHLWMAQQEEGTRPPPSSVWDRLVADDA